MLCVYLLARVVRAEDRIVNSDCLRLYGLRSVVVIPSA